jgi:hypothetical protein
MNRFVTICAIAAAAVAGPLGAASAGPVIEPGGQCNGVVDVGCRAYQCQPDDLDCGMIPPCVLWVSGRCLVG